EIENDHDFGRQTVDIFARIAEREAAGWTEAQILDELATLNANMFPCGMGEGNFKTYGQCNRWDYLLATQERNPVFSAFLQTLQRTPTPNDQKVLMKFNLFTQEESKADAPHPPALLPGLQPFAQSLCQAGSNCALPDLYHLAAHALPGAQPGVVAGSCQRARADKGEADSGFSGLAG
ncbi:MAG: hypothetical protein Q4G39_06285, partial [Brachymonas sp.]|nr:hypothetical protein [Brachymonas sp.]